MPYSLLPTWGAVLNLTLHRWSLSSPGMIILCVHPSFVLVSFECLCTFSPIIVSLWFPCPVNHKLIGLDTPLSSYHIPISALFPLFCHLFPCALEQKVLLLWMAWHHFAHFVSSPFYVDSFGKGFLLDVLFIYQFVFISGFSERVLVWHHSKQ